MTAPGKLNIRLLCRKGRYQNIVVLYLSRALSIPQLYHGAEIAEKAEISPENLVVRFSEAVDGFPLPKDTMPSTAV